MNVKTYFFVFAVIIITALAGLLAQNILGGYETRTVHAESFTYEGANRTLIYVRNNTPVTVHNVLNVTYNNSTLTYTREKITPSERTMFLAPTLFVSVAAFGILLGRGAS